MPWRGTGAMRAASTRNWGRMGSRGGVDGFRLVGAPQTLLTAVTESSRRLRAITANKRTVRRRTNHRSRSGVVRSVECTWTLNGDRAGRLGRSGRGGGTRNSGRLGQVDQGHIIMRRLGTNRAIPAPVTTIDRARSTMIFRTPYGSLTGHPGGALVRTLMPPICRAPVVTAPEI